MAAIIAASENSESMEAGAKIRSSMGEAKLNLHNTIPSNHPARDTESRVPKAVFIQTDGSETTVDAARGESVMRAAVRSNVDGILAECGGSLTCSTCHVYVDEGWLARLEPIEQDEAEMLEYTAAERRPNSRLSCQIKMRDELDGLRLAVPECQL